jgi:hypothetical protein
LLCGPKKIHTQLLEESSWGRHPPGPARSNLRWILRVLKGFIGIEDELPVLIKREKWRTVHTVAGFLGDDAR